MWGRDWGHVTGQALRQREQHRQGPRLGGLPVASGQRCGMGIEELVLQRGLALCRPQRHPRCHPVPLPLPAGT